MPKKTSSPAEKDSNITTSSPYTCVMCDKKYKYKGRWQQHMMLKHQIPVTALPVSPSNLSGSPLPSTSQISPVERDLLEPAVIPGGSLAKPAETESSHEAVLKNPVGQQIDSENDSDPIEIPDDEPVKDAVRPFNPEHCLKALKKAIVAPVIRKLFEASFPKEKYDAELIVIDEISSDSDETPEILEYDIPGVTVGPNTQLSEDTILTTESQSQTATTTEEVNDESELEVSITLSDEERAATFESKIAATDQTIEKPKRRIKKKVTFAPESDLDPSQRRKTKPSKVFAPMCRQVGAYGIQMLQQQWPPVVDHVRKRRTLLTRAALVDVVTTRKTESVTDIARELSFQYEWTPEEYHLHLRRLLDIRAGQRAEARMVEFMIPNVDDSEGLEAFAKELKKNVKNIPLDSEEPLD